MKTTPSEQDQQLFFQEMSGVQPLKNSDKIPLNTIQEVTPGQRYRLFAAQYSDQEKNSALSLLLKQQLGVNDWLEFKRDGLQYGVFKNLRCGKYPLEATLNLHGKTPTQARDELLDFVCECQKCNIRSVLMIFGRGITTGMLIKSYLAQWLPNLHEVQAFHTALKHHGGDRAVYVLLRKSAEKKAETRERHAARLAQ